MNFHPSAISWSKRNRGSVQRTHMKRKSPTKVLTNIIAPVATVCASPGVSSQCVKGMSQPPKKSVATIAETVSMLEYSAMKKSENFIALYSVW